MKGYSEEVTFRTKVDEVADITDRVAGVVARSKFKNGLACVFCVGSTAAVTTMEFEDGLVSDIGEALERLAPRDAAYGHEARWHDGNGHSHVRASLLGPSLTVPFADGRLRLGTWQQIVFLELDVRGRDRRVVVQLLGE